MKVILTRFYGVVSTEFDVTGERNLGMIIEGRRLGIEYPESWEIRGKYMGIRGEGGGTVAPTVM